MKDSDKLIKITLMREAAKRLTLGPDTLPSICFYSVLNAHARCKKQDFPVFLFVVSFPYGSGDAVEA